LTINLSQNDNQSVAVDNQSVAVDNQSVAGKGIIFNKKRSKTFLKKENPPWRGIDLSKKSFFLVAEKLPS